jgi:hypothetical protein
MSLLYAGILAVSFSLHAEKLLGGGVSITLHGIVKDEGGAAVSGARVIISKHYSRLDTVLSAQDGSFSWVYNFIQAGGGHQIFTYPYTIEKAGYVTVSDTVVIDTFQMGDLVVVRDMGTITLAGEDKTDLRGTSFSIPVGNTPQVSETVFTVTVSGRVISPVAGTPARSSAIQIVIQKDASNRYRITGLQKHTVKGK